MLKFEEYYFFCTKSLLLNRTTQNLYKNLNENSYKTYLYLEGQNLYEHSYFRYAKPMKL